MATAARFNAGVGSLSARRINAAQRSAIFRLVASLKGRMALDYTMRAIDEMTENAGDRWKFRNDRQGRAAKLKSDGWKIAETTGFMHLIGPLWKRLVDGELEFALITEDKHHDRRGLVQGGVLMTFADRTCGITARFVSGKPTLATVQLDTHFVEAGKIGELLI